jgi:hypothetical protein
LVEFLPSKQAVAGSSPVSRSNRFQHILSVTLSGTLLILIQYFYETGKSFTISNQIVL